MATMTLELDPVALREATAQAIMGTLTPELREQMLRQSISKILSPSTDSWNRGKSPLEEAFEQATTQVAREIVKDMVAQDQAFMAQLRDLIRKVADKVLGCDVDKLAERMADAFTSSLRSA